MSKELKRIEEASRLITVGLAVLLGIDEASVHDAVQGQKKNTKVRETGDDGEDEKPAKRKLKAPAEDEDEDEKPKSKKKPAADDDDDDAEAVEIPDDEELDDIDRADLKSKP